MVKARELTTRPQPRPVAVFHPTPNHSLLSPKVTRPTPLKK